MTKKSQITIFIILGLVIVLIIYLLFMLQSAVMKVSSKAKSPGEISPVNIYITSCLEKSSKNAIWDIGLAGGKEDAAESIYSKEYDIPIYKNNEKEAEEIPSISEIEQGLEDNILYEFDKCFDINAIKNIGFENVTVTSDISANVVINDKNIFITLKCPLKLEKQNFMSRISNFSITVPVSLGELYSSALAIMANAGAGTEESPYDISQHCAEYDKNLFTNIYIIHDDEEMEDDENVIQLIDYSTFFSKYMKSYIFQFGLKGMHIKGVCSVLS